jgi:uncharacterized membrane protein YjjB (DUF3815 family)
MIYFILQFIYAFISTVGFCILFNVPRSAIFHGSLTGGVGWTVYILLRNPTNTSYFAIFIASITVATLGEILARIDKKPVTVFLIPAIVPLVPGYAIYFSMINLMNKNFTVFAQSGTQALFFSGFISIGIILVTSLARLFKRKHKKNIRTQTFKSRIN